MQQTPQHVVACARSWLGTRFHHQGRLKKSVTHNGGVDCLGLLIGIAATLDLRSREGGALAELDSRCYGHYPDGIRLRKMLEQYLSPVSERKVQEADIVLFAPDSDLVPRHLAVITAVRQNQSPLMLHAYAQARRVVEHPMDDGWKQKWVATYRLPLNDIFSP